MNRAEIKAKAKAKLEGNMWNIWQAILIILVINMFVGFITNDMGKVGGGIAEMLFTLALTPLTVGLCKYILDLVRGEKFEIKTLFNSYSKILMIVAAAILSYVIIAVGFILLIIPGIIAGIALAMIYYIIADGEEDPVEALKGSYNMMNGYKWDYFVFCLSFIGWILLSVITLGIALIWVYPYLSVAFAMYYDELKKLRAGEDKVVEAEAVEITEHEEEKPTQKKPTTKKAPAKRTTAKKTPAKKKTTAKK